MFYKRCGYCLTVTAARLCSRCAGRRAAFTVDPNTYRLLGVVAYITWVIALFVSSVVVWATSAVALRTRALPHWYALAGIVVGIVQLFGLFLFPFVAWWLWIIVTSVLLIARRGHARAAIAQPAV